jgi:nucleoside-diphosphate-sugar epimerase
VIHLLGKAHDTKNTAKEDEYFKVNYELTRSLYDAFLLSSAKKFIFLSTIKAVGDDKTYVRDALDLSEPQTPYASSKKKSEDYIRSLPVPEGKNYYILRPTLIYGPHTKGNLESLVKFVKSGFPYPFSSFENKRSYLSVRNLSYVLCTLVEKEYPSFTLNIANQDPIGTQEMLELLAKKMGKKTSGWNIPKGFIQMAAKIGDHLPFLPFNSEKLKKITSSFVVDTAEMEKTLRVILPEQTRNTITQII